MASTSVNGSATLESLEKGIEAIALERLRQRQIVSSIRSDQIVAENSALKASQIAESLRREIELKEEDIHMLSVELQAERKLRERCETRELALRAELQRLEASTEAMGKVVERERSSVNEEVERAKREKNILAATTEELRKMLKQTEITEREMQQEVDSLKRRLLIQETLFAQQLNDFQTHLSSSEEISNEKSRKIERLEREIVRMKDKEGEMEQWMRESQKKSVMELFYVEKLEQLGNVVEEKIHEVEDRDKMIIELRELATQSDALSQQIISDLRSENAGLKARIARVQNQITSPIKIAENANNNSNIAPPSNTSTPRSAKDSPAGKSRSQSVDIVSSSMDRAGQEVLEDLINNQASQVWEWAEFANAREGEVDALAAALERERAGRKKEVDAVKLLMRQTETAHVQALELLRNAEAKMEKERKEFTERETWLHHQLEEMILQVEERTRIALKLREELNAAIEVANVAAHNTELEEELKRQKQETIKQVEVTEHCKVIIEDLKVQLIPKPKQDASTFFDNPLIKYIEPPPPPEMICVAVMTDPMEVVEKQVEIERVTTDVDLGDKDQKRSTLRKAFVEFRHRNRLVEAPGLSDATPTRVGWLFKNKSKFSKWQRRWFVLTLNPATLRYFRHSEDKQPAGFLLLGTCEITFKSMKAPEDGHNEGIVIVPAKDSDQDKKERKYRLASKTQQDICDWRDAIELAVKIEKDGYTSPSVMLRTFPVFGGGGSPPKTPRTPSVSPKRSSKQ